MGGSDACLRQCSKTICFTVVFWRDKNLVIYNQKAKQKSKNTISLQRRGHVEMHPPRFCRYFVWARSPSFFSFHISVRFCRYFAWTSPFRWFSAKLWKHILSIFCVITSMFLISEKTGNQILSLFTMIPCDHAPLEKHLVQMLVRFCFYFACAHSFSKNPFFLGIYSVFRKWASERFLGVILVILATFFQFFVDILRVHAHFQVFRKKHESRFCRYFAWSQRDHVHFEKHCQIDVVRFCRYFAWSRPFRWFSKKTGKQILSLFDVGTLIFGHFQKIGGADFVAIWRGHAHFHDFRISRESRFCRFFACARSFRETLSNRCRKILSLFHVGTLIFMIPG